MRCRLAVETAYRMSFGIDYGILAACILHKQPFSHVLKEHSNSMEDIQSDLWKHYLLGDESLVPVGVDEERYRLRFLENSQRLFVSQGEQLEVMRVLSESGGEYPCIQYRWTHQGD